MALTDLITPQPDANPPSGITCAKYTRGEGKRCAHYLANGSCALPDELVCREWVKKNGRLPQPARDLFGNPAPELDLRREEPKTTEPVSPIPQQLPADVDEPDDRLLPHGLTAEDVASFKALNCEVCLRSDDLGEVWLVPEYTGAERKELSVEHAATLAAVCAAFPGAKVVSFERNTKPEQEVDE